MRAFALLGILVILQHQPSYWHHYIVVHAQEQQQQQPLTGDSGVCTTEQECASVTADNDVASTTQNPTLSLVNHDDNDQNEQDDDEEDPMLQLLPGTDKKVYVRADVATFYQKPPGSMTEQMPKFNGQAGKFVNMSPERVQLYWNGGPNKLVLIANIGPFQAGGTATFPTHQFLFRPVGNSDESNVLCDFVIQKGTSVYYYDPFSTYNETNDKDNVARCVPRPNYSTAVRNLLELSAEDMGKYQAHVYNLEFGKLYKNFTGGSEWLSMYPRNPPRHQIWRADYIGQQHTVSTRETHFVTTPPVFLEEQVHEKKKSLHYLTMDEMRRDNNAPLPFAEYREQQPDGIMNMTLTALSCAPRAFEIRNFLSNVEVDHILALVAQQHLERSTTGGHLSDTRTSTTTWIPRGTDHIVNAVIRRAADVLRIDEALMRQRYPYEYPDMLNNRKINEDMQIVHYDIGQEYTAHHDFGYYNGLHDSPTRSINVAMYLNTVEAGGETTFPRWRNAETVEELKVKPEKGKALIFFMTLPDGNLDDLTQHAALPVITGEKYFANLWLHDPYNR